MHELFTIDNVFIDSQFNYETLDANFLDLFISTDALHLSGCYSAHHQEHITLWWSAAVSVHCTKSCIYSQKVLLRMGEFVARNM